MVLAAQRWLLVVVLVALMSARPCNLLPGSLNLDDDPSHDGALGSFWSQCWYGGYVDDFLVKLRHAVVDDGLDPLQPPDEVHDIDERSGLSTWHADVRLEPRDLRALRKDSAAFDACQRHVQQLEEDQELADALVSLLIHLARALIYTNCVVGKAGLAPKYVMPLKLSYMFLGRMLRVAPSGDIFGQREELRMSIQRWLETSSPIPADTSPWPHGHSTRFKQKGNRLGTRGVLYAVSAGRSNQRRRSFWKR